MTVHNHAGVEPIVGRYLSVPLDGQQYRIYFESAGKGVPLVCLHTAGSHSSQFRHLMNDPQVTDRFEVIAFDLPWHGKSDPPVGWHNEEYKLTSDFYVAMILAFCETLGLEQPVVLGCSMGGRVVFRLAADAGERFGAVIGLEATDQPSPWWDDSWLESAAFDNGEFCASLVSGLVAPHSPSEFRHETLWHYHQGGSGVFKGDMHFFRSDSQFKQHATRIDTAVCPVYLMTGEYDYSCRPENTRATADRIPGAEVTIMEGVGHFPMSENPARFREYLLPVLESLLGTLNARSAQ